MPKEPRPKEGVWLALFGMLVFLGVGTCSFIDVQGVGLPFWCTLGIGSWVVWAWGCWILIRSLPRGKERRNRGALLALGLIVFGLAFLAILMMAE